MKPLVRPMVALLALWCVAADWRVAEPGWDYQFPRDHHAHPEFKTEWWYFTGNLADARGRRFGYELTFFRQGIRPPNERSPELSRFVTGDLKFAHFTITDAAAKQFHVAQKTSRGAYGEAGFDNDDALTWIDEWNLRMDAAGKFHLVAEMKDAAIELELAATKPPAIHGQNGVSEKAAGAGHASHYYSLPRLTSGGEVRIGSRKFSVTGESWFDHEWATNQLAPEQVGWNWLSLQLDDGSDLMLYQMRLANGAPDPSSSGTLIGPDGATTYLSASEFQMTPRTFWKSAKTGANYPIGWRVELPRYGLDFDVKAVIENQELALIPLAYWEGAVDAVGKRNGHEIKGRGYLELTGYAGVLRELQR
ncbi:MAG: carotenoid 1,2-hydratase [Verrucomicrobiota bacterium]|nr:carotenoid 1,2-hydratase [Verrucomicrobiota bacterium]